MDKKVITFGEIMLRLSAPAHKRFIQTDVFNANYGGGEANVAVSLALFGIDAVYVTQVPNNSIGHAAINQLRSLGVDTSFISKAGDRLGIYFVESGAVQRPSKVVYDRDNSAIREVQAGSFEWEKIFDGAKWFHWTGITPALGDSVVDCLREACRIAKKKGITISCDLNYRSKLWSREKANRVMTDLMEYVDVCIANEEDAAVIFDIKAAESNVSHGKLSVDGYRNVAKQLKDRFEFKYVAITLRESFSASHNGWSGLLYNGKDFYQSPRYDIVPIIDRVGGGDSFGAGLIYSLLMEKDCQNVIDFAVAASCLKHTISGDFNLVTVDEVEVLVKGDASGRVQR